MPRPVLSALFALTFVMVSSAATALTITLTPNPLNVLVLGSADMTVTLGDLDPLEWDYLVVLSSGPGSVTVPPSVLVPHGQTSAEFTVVAGGSEGADLITAQWGAVSDTAVVNVVAEFTPVPSISFGGLTLLGGLVFAIALAGLAVQRRRRAG